MQGVVYKDGMEKTTLRGRAYEQWLKDQAKRRREIKAMYRKERSLTLVGEHFGISKGRVSQIVNSAV